MKRLKQLIGLLLVCFVLALLPVTAQAAAVTYAVTGGNLTFDDSTGTITSCEWNVTEAIIPAEINGVAVTSIGESAFASRTLLTNVVIPTGVHTLGRNAFYGCKGLKSITIPGSVTTMDSAFYSCSNLESVTIGTGVTEIGNSVFHNCTGLKSVTIPDSVTSIGEKAFYGCTALESVSLPENLDTIGDYAFYNCTGLKNIAIPDNVTSIGENAFNNCAALESVSLPENLDTIGAYSFHECANLTGIRIPENVTSIGDYAFFNCSSLTSITIPQSVTNCGASVFQECTGITEAVFAEGTTSIGASVFNSCTSLARVTIPDGVQSIGNGAFVNCTSLTSVTIPDSVTSMDTFAFSGCSGLTSVTIPNGVTTISNSTFYMCTGLTSVTIPAGVTTIDNYAFADCTALKTVYYGGTEEGWKSVTVGTNNDPLNSAALIVTVASGTCGTSLTWKLTGDGVLTISGAGYMASYDDSGNRAPWYAYREDITSVVIESGVTGISLYAFDECTALTSVKLPEGVTSIGSAAFADCSALESIELPDDLQSIGNWAFSNCTSLAGVELPDGLSYIGPYAFYNCNKIESIVIPGGVGTIGDSAISDCASLTTVTISEGVQSIGNNAFQGCTSLTAVTFPDSVISIGDFAFRDCSALTAITIPDSVTSVGIRAFGGCSAVQSVELGNGVTSLDPFALNGSNKLVSIKIGDGITAIPDYAFMSCENLQTVVLSDALTEIGDGAFQNCKRLADITLPEGLITIGDRAFNGCMVSLTAINIPASVETIGASAFVSCNKLASITVDAGNANYCSDGGVLFNKDKTTLIKFPSELQAGSYTVPATVTTIADYAFEFTSVPKIVVPDTVKSLGAHAFDSCVLSEITLGNAIQEIPENAFYYCPNLTSIVLPDSVVEIGRYAFGQCRGLTEVTIPASVEVIDEYAFAGDNALTTVHFKGDETQWKAISIGANNEPLLNAAIDYSGSIAVVLTAPTLNVERNVSGKPYLTWNAVDGATKYELQYSVDGKNFSTLISTPSRAVTHSSALAGTVYYYRVRALAGSAAGEFSAVKSIRCISADDIALLESAQAAGLLKYMGGVDLYAQATRMDVAKIILALTGATENVNRPYPYADGSNLTAQEKNILTALFAYRIMLGMADGTFNPTGPVTRAEIAVLLYRCMTGDVYGSNAGLYEDYATKVFIDVPAGNWATGYIGYCANTGLLSDVGETFSPGNTADVGTVLRWMVNASARNVRMPAPLLSVSLNENYKPVMTWTSNEKAVKYTVYYSTDGKNFSVLKTITGTALTHSSAVTGGTYYYQVCAIDAKGSGSYSSVVKVIAAKPLDAPVLKVVLNSAGKPYLTWNAVDGATSYSVTCSTDGQTFNYLTTVTGTALIHSSAVAGTTYYYMVAAASDTNRGQASNVVKITVDAGITAPTLVVSKNSEGKPYLSWTAVNGATKYEVYFSADGETFTKLISTTGKTLTHSSAKAGMTYYYKVCAINATTTGAFSAVKSVSVAASLAAPTLTVSKTSAGKPYLSWTAVSGATKYEVYFSTDGKTFTKLISTAGKTLTHTSAKAGTTYYYKVCAINATTTGAFSAVKSVSVVASLAAPTLTVTKNSAGKPYLSWTAVTGATKYEVYSSTDGKTFTKLISTTGKVLTHTSAKAGTTYYYKVRAINATITGAFSAVEKAAANLSAPTLTVTKNSAGKPYLTWTGVTGATKYEVYYSTNGTSFTKLIATTGKVLTHSSAKAGTTYYYKVCAINATTTGAFSAVVTASVN